MSAELTHAWRALSKRPLSTALTAAALALGIGACTAVFTLLDAVVLRPLPVRDPDRLVQLSSRDPQDRAGYVAARAIELIDRAEIFERICSFLTPQSTVEFDGRARPIAALAASGTCFDLLGIGATVGRLLQAADDAPGAPNVAVLSYQMWQREFGGRIDAIGRVISVEGEPFTIVGVTERRFAGLQVGYPGQLIVPLSPRAFLPRSMRRVAPAANAFALLKTGSSFAQADARLQALWPEILADSTPEGSQGRQREAYLASRVLVTPAATGLGSLVRTRFQAPLMALMGIAGVVLVISSMNVANLLLARVMERRREHAIRAAMGASRLRLMREGLVEAGLLVLPAAAVGLWLAQAVVDVLVSVYAATSRNFWLDVTADARTIAFALASAASAWLFVALVPAASAASVRPSSALATLRFGNGLRQGWARRALIVGQVALTLLLVAAAAWFGGTLRALRAVPLGFESDGVVTARLAAVPGGYDDSFESSVYYRGLLERVSELPGVRAVALTNAAPPVAVPYRDAVVRAGGAEPASVAQVIRVSDGFFAALRLPLIAGSDLARSDGSKGVTAVVSRSLARQLFRSDAPIGERIAVGGLPQDQSIEIVGVAADATIGDQRLGNQPAVYLNYWQQGATFQQFPVLLVRSEVGMADLVLNLRQEIARGGREYLRAAEPLADALDHALIQERLLTLTATLFGAIGLVLAGVGLFGLLRVTVASRTRDLGIRLALGATRRRLFGGVLQETFISLAMGVGVGLPLVGVAGRLLSALLYGFEWYTPAVLGSTVALVVAVGVAAALLPAHRATMVDPVTSLRCE